MIEHSIYKPQLIFWETTKACPLACKHCRAQALLEPLPDQLSPEESISMIESLTEFGKPYPVLILTGGDVMLRKDLESILRKAKDLGIKVALSPAVSEKLNEASAKLARRYGIHSISLSLDWSSPEKQDSFRGKYETFARTLDAIQIFSSYGIPVQINTTVYRDNLFDLPKMLSLISRLGIKVWELFFLIRIGRGEVLDDLTPYEMEAVNGWIASIKKERMSIRTVESPIVKRIELQGQIYEGSLKNEVYQKLISSTEADFSYKYGENPALPPGRRMKTIFIGQNGDVLINGFVERSLGNIRKSSITSICTDNEILDRLERPGSFNGKCGYCEYNKVCGGSRARAYSTTGDLFGSDPGCIYVPMEQRLNM
ncbi:MAG: radical SAM protein [Thermoplasmataceae archaeon]